MIQFQDIEEGVTMSEQVDSVTGFATKVITETKGADYKPTVLIDRWQRQSFGTSRTAIFQPLRDSCGRAADGQRMAKKCMPVT